MPSEWTEEDWAVVDPYLGKQSDHDLGRSFPMCASAIRRRRNRKGIPKYKARYKPLSGLNATEYWARVGEDQALLTGWKRSPQLLVETKRRNQFRVLLHILRMERLCQK